MLAEKLYNLDSFKDQYDALLALSVCRTIPSLKWKSEPDQLLSRISWNNVIGIASALAYADANEHLDAALRIAQTALVEESTNSAQKDAAAVILHSLTNRPAIQLAIKRGLIEESYLERLPFTLRIQSERKVFESSIVLNNELIELNSFQKEVYSSSRTNEAISISAPTSAGKSFILCNLLVDHFLKGAKNIVYVVPTRALISQVETDLRELFSKHDLAGINITTIPQGDPGASSSNLFVFTQERLHWLLAENPNWSCDVLVIDEAHKIEDGHRGILLQQKLEELVSRRPDVKVYFSSPFTSNPELLLENVGTRSKKARINTKFVAVNQNLIYASQVSRKPKQWKLVLCLPEKVIDLGEVLLQDRPAGSELKKIAFISNSFSEGEKGNIVYANGAAEAENVALLFYDLLPVEELSSEVNELINLVKKTIHKHYRLARVLEKRVCFHYGNMPLIVREEIERLFKVREIRHLVCTSTLLEGVNLPAKAIYVRKPTRGRGNPLSANDFWNLAGRAGRWGKEFSGNIVCIEPSKWEIPPSPNRSKQKIRRAIDVIEKDGDQLVEFIKDGSKRSAAEKRPDLEFAFGYYYSKHITDDLDKNNVFHQELGALFDEIRPSIEVPDEIVRRNPGISPLAQQHLWDYFKERLDRIDEMVPVYPEDEDAYEEYASLVGRIGKTLASYPYQLNYSRAVLLINWMSGKPLSYIISKSHESWLKKGREDKNINVVIREVMNDVENFVRFRFAKDSSCYVDILRHFLRVHDRHDLAEEIPQLNLWLEFGVAQKTHLSFLALGLSRNTTIEVVDRYITNTGMTTEEAFEWLNAQDLETIDLSAIMLADISRALDGHSSN